ncbi:hypothetical protein [Yokenella regensburgei]|uniref:hypothetical protein n=1 Tax=Yokenella regensburgei TaxID=158877 RepID=UPI0028A17136|nr:hypothetical protein [Yokenella regensburgei]
MDNKPTTDLDKLHAAVTDMDSLSQTAFNQISAITTLLLSWLETPRGQVGSETVAEALNCVAYLAQNACENIGYEAERVGCGFEDDSQKRRIDSCVVASGYREEQDA